MADEIQPPETCKSIFKEGKSAPTVSSYTKMWITLINKLERRKENNPPRAD